MKETTKFRLLGLLQMIVGILILVFVITILINIFNTNCCACGIAPRGLNGYIEEFFNPCCAPCPNPEWQDKVKNFTGRKAACSHNYLEMCKEYEEANNITIECFK